MVDSLCAFLLCMYVCAVHITHCVFTVYLADSVNLCGNSGAAIKLPAPVCSGLTSKPLVYSQPCRREGVLLVCLARKALSFVRLVRDLSPSIVMLYKNVAAAFVDFFVECFNSHCVFKMVQYVL